MQTTTEQTVTRCGRPITCLQTVNRIARELRRR